MSAPGPLLEIDGVAKSFGSIRAVDGIDLAVAPNEFFALLGPSGCGKTTLLRLIAGFEHPDRGAIRLDGADITAVKPNKRPINLMFQSYALFPHMTVFGNVAYGLEMEGLRGTALQARVEEALALVHLSEQAGRKPHQLSGGQKQRVALARALVKRPKLLLLDEPLGALDKKLREKMQIELKRLQQETGIGFLVVTHDQEEALTMADRIALLDKGRIAQLGKPRDLYERPDSRFVADFVGQMNFFEGQRRGNGFEVAGLGRLPAQELDALPEGADASLAVRPERVSLLEDAHAGTLAATVVGSAYMGQDVIVHLTLAKNGMPLVARLPASHRLAAAVENGRQVHCSWAAEHARLLVK
jgi:spermidine/putrescine transport system ATP-binding protein/putrescine transport system ATP-binding protein